MPPAMDRQAIEAYLARLGLDGIDPDVEQISCWDTLQAFVSSRLTIRPLTKPFSNSRLKTYGLDQRHLVRMLLRHVIS